MARLRLSYRSLAVLFVLVLTAPALFAAEGGDARVETQETRCQERHVDVVGDACRLPNGLYRVTLDDGHTLTTHGADPLPADGETDTLSGNERHPRCATDYYQHVLYGRPANAADRSGEVEEELRSIIRRMNWILNEDALESGGVTADYKVLCDSAGFIRVDSFVVPSSSSDFNAIVNAARSAGFSSSRADYTIFYDAGHSSACGIGHISYDERPGQNNYNNFGGDYGVTYKTCWQGRTPMHENGHNQGAVQRSAPDSDGAGHCIEGRDIMCYPTSQVLVLCTDRIHFDCDHDTYFNAHPEPGGWLQDHWNIGSRVNRFIAFGDTDPAPPNQAPEVNLTFTLDDHDLVADASGSSDADGDPLHYRWTLGDGTTAEGPSVTHTYPAPGRYTLRLTVSDAKGGFDATHALLLVAPDVEPRVETFAFDGRIGCSIGLALVETADQCRNSDTQQRFDVSIAPGATATKVAVRWGDADAPAGLLSAREMHYYWTTGGLNGSAAGPSPVVGHHPIDPTGPIYLTGSEATLQVRPSGTSGFVKDQPFAVCIAVVYADAELPAGTCSG